MHHCGNVDSIDIARGIQSVVFCRRNFLSTRKNYLYSLSQIYQSCPHWVHCAFSLFPITSPPKSFWGRFPYPRGVGAQCWEVAFVCVPVVAGSGWLLWCVLLGIPLVEKAFAPGSQSHWSLTVKLWSLCNQQFEILFFYANKWANVFQVATTVSALLTRHKLMLSSTEWACVL